MLLLLVDVVGDVGVIGVWRGFVVGLVDAAVVLRQASDGGS